MKWNKLERRVLGWALVLASVWPIYSGVLTLLKRPPDPGEHFAVAIVFLGIAVWLQLDQEIERP